MSNNHTPIDHIIDEENNKNQESISYSKESEPIPAKKESQTEAKIDIVETEPDIEDKELEQFIQVEKKPEIELDPALKKAGLQVLDTNSLDPKHNVKLPIADEKIIEGLQQPVNSSWRWLSEIAIFMLKRAHISLKKIHGHIVRVIKK
ncbi:MAG TPA: hypothetical protein PLS49_09230 [Candidatus Woesebacteria bacterium]|nr:hypothetical protein [Candidatus Woesebacteria bacterium]